MRVYAPITTVSPSIATGRGVFGPPPLLAVEHKIETHNLRSHVARRPRQRLKNVQLITILACQPVTIAGRSKISLRSEQISRRNPSRCRQTPRSKQTAYTLSGGTTTASKSLQAELSTPTRGRARGDLGTYVVRNDHYAQFLLLLPRKTPRQRPRVREAVQPPERRDADRQRRRGPAEGRGPAEFEFLLGDVERV